jgi:hypothetical protein
MVLAVRSSCIYFVLQNTEGEKLIQLTEGERLKVTVLYFFSPHYLKIILVNDNRTSFRSDSFLDAFAENICPFFLLFLSSFAEHHIKVFYKMRGVGRPYFSDEASDDKTIFLKVMGAQIVGLVDRKLKAGGDYNF